MLAGKRVLVTGVATRQSIAFAIAREAQAAGAEVILTSFGRMRSMTERAAARLDGPPDVLELDVNEPEDHHRLALELERRWGGIDGIVHAVAFAPGDALGGNFMNAPDESAMMAFRTSALSLKTLTGALRPLLQRAERGGSVVALDFDATVAWPGYDWMGVAKAGLESVARYLARDLGPEGVRVNLVSAGPLRTVAASGVPGFHLLADRWAEQAPLGWDPTDPEPVAAAACFLLSDGARGISGEMLHVDGGFHAMGAPLVGADELAQRGNGAAGRTPPALAGGP